MDEEFESFVVTNPDLVDEGIDVSGLRTTTDTSPFLLGNIPDSPGIQYSTLAPTKYTDLMRFYSEGLPTTATDTAQIPGAVDTLVDVGSGDGGQATTIQPIDTPITTDITSDQIDEFATPTNTGGITGDPIQMENIASNPYDIPMDIDDPGASIENIIAQNPSGTIEGAPVVPGVDVTGDPSQNMLDVPTQDVGLAYTGDFDPDDEGTVYSNEVNNALLPPEQQDPGFWETARDNFIQTGQDVGNFFKDLGGQGLDIAQLAGTTILNLAGKALTGVPLLGTAANLIGATLPPRDPRQTALEEFYNLDDIGRVAEGELMAGYNPVSGSDTLSDLTGGFLPELTYGLQDAYQDRIDTIENTLATQYPDGDYSETELDERLAELKDAKAREKDLLDAVVTGAPQEDIGATDTISDLEIATGIQAEADRIEAERRALQEINAAAAREQAAAEQKAREEADARIAAEAASRAAAARAAADAARRNQGSGNGDNRDRGNRDTGGARGGGTSATSSGLGDLGFSDIRLKDNIELIGKSPSNINIYKFNYKGDSTIYQGAMANEVSWASVKADNGYLMIDYDKIDVEFKKYAK